MKDTTGLILGLRGHGTFDVKIDDPRVCLQIKKSKKVLNKNK